MKVRVNDLDTMSIRLPDDHDHGDRISDAEALAWATLAAVPFANKVLGHRLPEDVAAALEVISGYALRGGGEVRRYE